VRKVDRDLHWFTHSLGLRPIPSRNPLKILLLTQLFSISLGSQVFLQLFRFRNILTPFWVTKYSLPLKATNPNVLLRSIPLNKKRNLSIEKTMKSYNICFTKWRIYESLSTTPNLTIWSTITYVSCISIILITQLNITW